MGVAEPEFLSGFWGSELRLRLCSKLSYPLIHLPSTDARQCVYAQGGVSSTNSVPAKLHSNHPGFSQSLTGTQKYCFPWAQPEASGVDAQVSFFPSDISTASPLPAVTAVTGL